MDGDAILWLVYVDPFLHDKVNVVEPFAAEDRSPIHQPSRAI